MTLRTQTKVFSIFHARKKKVIDHHQIRDHFSDTVNMRSMFSTLGTMGNLWYTGGKNVWCERPFYLEKIMRFRKSPQLPGAGRTREWHHHGSHTPTSPGAILPSKLGKMARRAVTPNKSAGSVYLLQV